MYNSIKGWLRETGLFFLQQLKNFGQPVQWEDICLSIICLRLPFFEQPLQEQMIHLNIPISSSIKWKSHFTN